jgi:hypothetical protein
VTELEYRIEIARVRAEARAALEDIRQFAKDAIDKLADALQLAAAEHKMLIQLVYSSGDAQTIRDMDRLLKALPERFSHLSGQSQIGRLH